MKVAKILAGLAAVGLALTFLGCPVSVDSSSAKPAENGFSMRLEVPTWANGKWDYDKTVVVDGAPGIDLNDVDNVVIEDNGNGKTIHAGNGNKHSVSNPNPGFPRVTVTNDGKVISSGIFGVPDEIVIFD